MNRLILSCFSLLLCFAAVGCDEAPDPAPTAPVTAPPTAPEPSPVTPEVPTEDAAAVPEGGADAAAGAVDAEAEAPSVVAEHSQGGSVPSAEPLTLRVDAADGRLRLRLSSLNTFCAPQPTFALERDEGARRLTLHLLHPEVPSRCVGPHDITLVFPIRAESMDEVELRGEDSELLGAATREGVAP